MRLAKASLTLLAIAATAATLPAAAQVGQPVSLPAPMPALAASGPTLDMQKAPLTSAAVEAVPMGTSARNTTKGAGTMRELEDLQRQTALAEMRKRLNELGQPAAGTPNPMPGAPATLAGVPQQGLQMPTPSTKPGVRRMGLPNGVPTTMPEPPAMDAPRARVVNVLVVAGRARADVLEEGRLFTVKEGDGLAGKWVVSSITPEGVMVERRKKVVAAQQPGKSTVVASLPGAAGLLGGESDSARFDVLKLEPVNQFELSQAMISTTVNVQGATAPGIPPLPAPVRTSNKPDSTTTAVIPPLPASNGF